jgi:N-acetylmuramoyl-L-alanine amidase
MRIELTRTRSIITLAAAAAVILAGVPRPARAQTTAASLYERAQAREKEARSASPVVPGTLEAVAKSYEAIVRRYPTSGYADNALWQAAGLLTLAFEQSGDGAYRASAAKMLDWLRKEYPSSSLARQAGKADPSEDPPAAPPVAPPPPAPTSSPAPAGPLPAITSISQTSLPRGERITIELSREVTFTGDRVGSPDRIFLDFASATASAAILEQARQASGSLVKSLRLGRHSAGVTRVVLDLAGKPRYHTFQLYEPFRLVIDVEADDGAPSAASGPSAVVTPPAVAPALVEPRRPAPPPAPSPLPVGRVSSAALPGSVRIDATPPPAPATPASNRGGDYSLARQLGLGVSRIVIDAGHGGHDPGAQGNGIVEADLVLDVAHRLEKLLTAVPGVEVVLTRSTDEFIPLEERTAIANRQDADLFLSIHANASRQSSARGIETYVLNFASSPNAEAVAARENATSAQNMGTLPDLLRKIALNSKLAESRELAGLVQTSLIRRLSLQNKSVKDLGVKEAPFVVLIGAQIPSVLAEISFLSNKSEAALLKQSSYRQRIAQALCDAVLKYQASLKSTVATTRETRK